MTSVIDPNLTEQTGFFSISEFSQITGISLTTASRGVRDGLIQHVTLTNGGKKWIPKSEVEKFKGMKKAAPRGPSVSRQLAEEKMKVQNVASPAEPNKIFFTLEGSDEDARDFYLAVRELHDSLKRAAKAFTENC